MFFFNPIFSTNFCAYATLFKFTIKNIAKNEFYDKKVIFPHTIFGLKISQYGSKILKQNKKIMQSCNIYNIAIFYCQGSLASLKQIW